MVNVSQLTNRLPEPTIVADRNTNSYLNELLRVVRNNFNILEQLIRSPKVYSFSTVDEDYTVKLTDEVVLIDTTDDHVTVNLPPCATFIGRILILKTIENSGNNLTINPNGSEEIDGSSSSIVTASNYLKYQLFSDGTSWWTLI